MRRYRLIPAIGALAGLLLCAGAATAEQERGPECYWDPVAQRFAAGGAPAWVNAGGGRDFAATFSGDDDRHAMILHHCPSDRYLLIVARDAGLGAVQDRFNHLLETDTRYTMDQIGSELAALGAGVRRGQGDIGRCDCDYLASTGLSE